MPARKVSPTRGAGVRVMIVDDHPLWRRTLRDLLQQAKAVRVVAEAGDGADAVTEAMRSSPDVVVMDLDLPTLGGIDATRQITAACPDTKVLVLSSSAAGDQVREAVRAGACGYLVKTADPEHVTDAVRRIHAGELVFPAALTNFVRQELHGDVSPVFGAPTIRIVLVGGAAPQREALAKALTDRGLEVRAVGSVSALVAAAARGSDVIVADLSSGGSSGTVGAIHDVRRDNPAVGIVLLLDRNAEEATPLEPFDGTGGIGYLRAEDVASVADLHAAIARVGAGETVVDPQIAQHLVRRRREKRPLDELSERERAVLALMAEGHSNQGIAAALALSPKTIEAHVAMIFTKLGLEATSEHHRRVLAVVAYLQSL